ncbi:MAG: MBOAT family O-acyltransferase [Bacillota bacterium]
MDFVSFEFAVVLVLTLPVYYATPSRYRAMLLAGLNLALLAWVAPVAALVVGALALAVFALVTRASWRLAVVAALSVLGYVKYSHFAVANLHALGWAVPFPPFLSILGISYFAFRLVSFALDVHRGVVHGPSLVSFFNYILFFPTVVAGPIDRYNTFSEAARPRMEELTPAVGRIITGLFKKAVLAGVLAGPAAALTVPGLPAARYLAAMYAYALLIYVDFSAYTDMAVGSASLFGYRVMENFDRPYLKTNLSLFWKSWHMSLTRWFRDYLFIPLGGSRGTLARTVANTFLVMLVTGLWHGPSWNFVFWGLYHAVGLTVHRVYRTWAVPRLPRLWLAHPVSPVLSWALTFHFVAVGWVLFHAGTRQFIHILGTLARGIWP